MTLLYNIRRIFNAVLNLKLGTLSAVCHFTVVFFVNQEHGLQPAILAALKGGIWSFVTGGFFGRITERFSDIKNRYVAYPLGAILPTIVSYSFLGIIHYTTATPEPFWSTMASMMLSMFVFAPTTIFVLRRGYFKTKKVPRPAHLINRDMAEADEISEDVDQGISITADQKLL